MTEFLSESGLSCALNYLHSCRELVALGYRLHHDDVCARIPKHNVPDYKTEPEAFAAWLAQVDQELSDFKAERKAQAAAAKAEKRRLRGW